jgi:hypothetical protein
MHPCFRILATSIVLLCSLTNGFAQPRADLGWEPYRGSHGTRDDVPTRLFRNPTGPADKGVGEAWTTSDGRARLSIYVLHNDDGYSPANYLRRYLTEPPSQIDYRRVTPTFFAVSKVGGDRIFYRRCNFADAIHCVELAYPKNEKRTWDPIVTRISRSLRPLLG